MRLSLRREAGPGDPRRRATRWLVSAAALALSAGLAACSSAAPAKGTQSVSSSTAAKTSTAAKAVPRPAHTVIVMLENHGYHDVIGSAEAPFLNQLARRGALFTNSHAIAHPSEPNYLALFSGSTHGVLSDTCPVTFSSPNLATGLVAAGDTFTGYAEGLPSPDPANCIDGEYARKHVPWMDFTNVPTSESQPFTSFPANFASLPTVSWVVPNLCDDMHDCTAATGDEWMQAHLASYANWAMTHNSLLIVTWDEDEGSDSDNQIPTIFVGQPVRPGKYSERITHYSVLATIEAAYGLTRDGAAATTAPITDVWR